MGISTTRIVERCQVAPSSGAPTELLLPLLHSDMVFLSTNLMEILFFYTLPSCSESHFSDNIVPNLKKSLSLTLKHFTPLAGNIIFPLTTGMPISQYITGDSISMAIAVSDADLTHLTTGNLSRDADQFHDFVARLPPATYFPDFIKFSIAAIQVTLFPDQGFCIGVTMHHSIGDGSTIAHFTKAWSSITKFNGDDAHLLAQAGQKCLSFHDRSGVQDADSLATTCWGFVKNHRPTISSINYVPTHKVRATFVMSRAQTRNLINLVTNKKPSLAVHVSSFTIVCAIVWTSLAKSAADAGEEVADDEPEYLNCAVDSRARLSQPLPDSYFGNSLESVLADSTHGRLKGDEGIVFAAEAIGEAIRKTIDDGKGGILDGTVGRLLELQRVQMNGNRMVGISGSPRFDVYDRDFGWGRPKSFEAVHIDSTKYIFLSESRESEGGVEIGLSMSKVKMDAFAAILEQGLKEATKHFDACNTTTTHCSSKL